MNWHKARSAFATAMRLGAVICCLPGLAEAASITLVPAPPLVGAPICKPGFPSPQCLAQSFDTSADVAYQGGDAATAVARDTVPGYSTLHQSSFANDGQYGNGSSWIGISSNAWLKIDLGSVMTIDRVLFGRDRLSGFDDRDPGQFTISVALSDNVYADGNEIDDATEYTLVLDSSLLGFSGLINGAETIQAAFDPVLARYVRLSFANAGAAIDEVEILAADLATVPVPGSGWLIGGALLGMLARRRGLGR